MALRKGAGRLRHLHTQYLWCQDVFDRKEAQLTKEKGEDNEADLMTKHLGKQVLERHLMAISQEFQHGRAESSLEI